MMPAGLLAEVLTILFTKFRFPVRGGVSTSPRCERTSCYVEVIMILLKLRIKDTGELSARVKNKPVKVIY